MWFIGGRGIAEDTSPLVVLSLEPLVDDAHYPRQVAYSSRGLKDYKSWQLDYFDVFPTAELAGPKPQPYWRTMSALVAGYRGVESTFDWNIFRGTYIELPLVPLHSAGHDRLAFDAAASYVEAQLRERLRLVVASWPRATFFCAGRDVADALRGAPNTTDVALELPSDAHGNREKLGAALFRHAIHRRSVDIGDGATVDVFVRRAPFTTGHQPKPAGCRLLGQLLRDRWGTSA
jgi:hypothetical protein